MKNFFKEQMRYWSGFSPMQSGYLGGAAEGGPRMSDDAASALSHYAFANVPKLLLT